MSAVVDLPGRVDTLPGLLKRALIATWLELPRVVAACAIWAASLVPLVLSSFVAQLWVTCLALLPAALLTTGLVRFAAPISRGDRSRVRDIFVVDPLLAATLAAAAAGTLWLIVTPRLELAGFVVAAVTLIVSPLALAYAAVRDRRGFLALRGGVILAAFRPSWALTLLSVTLLGAFAIVATAGALLVFIPGMLAAFASGITTCLLQSIDESQVSR